MFLRARRPTLLLAVALVVLGLNFLSVGQAQASPPQAGSAQAPQSNAAPTGQAQAAPLRSDLVPALAPKAPPKPDYGLITDEGVEAVGASLAG
jgi:hypothetical protein